MKSVNIQISDFEFDQLGLNKNTLSFSELIEIIGKKITKQTLEKSIKLANKYGLSKMTMEEIDEEIKAHRNEKNNSWQIWHFSQKALSKKWQPARGHTPLPSPPRRPEA